MEGERRENGLGIAPGSGGTYGDPWGLTGTPQTDFGFTGEPTGLGGLIHLRARYYNPALGVFTALDPVEGNMVQAMSLNLYGYSAQNPTNATDPSGNCWVNPDSTEQQKDYCMFQWSRYVQSIYQLYGTNNPEANSQIFYLADFWGNLDFETFMEAWNDPDFAPQGNKSGFFGVTANAQIAVDPATALLAILGACIGAIVLSSNNGSIALPRRRTVGDDIEDLIKWIAKQFGRSIPIPLPRDNPKPTPMPQVNIDTGAATLYSSADPNAVTEQARLINYLAGKQWLFTETANAEFVRQVSVYAGKTEIIRAGVFLSQVQRIPDTPSARVMALVESNRIGLLDKKVFGTGDQLGIITVTTDRKFYTAALPQGVNLAVEIFTPYSFVGK